MAFMLDTNVAIHLRDAEPAILRRIDEVDDPIVLSVVTLVELEGGVVRNPATAAHRREALDAILSACSVLPFGDRAALEYRRIVEQLGFRRATLLDRMIAAHAIAEHAVLATLNPRDFREVPGLKLADWSA